MRACAVEWLRTVWLKGCLAERCGDGDGFGFGESNSAHEKVGKVGVVVGGIGGDEDAVLVGGGDK